MSLSASLTWQELGQVSPQLTTVQQCRPAAHGLFLPAAANLQHHELMAGSLLPWPAQPRPTKGSESILQHSSLFPAQGVPCSQHPLALLGNTEQGPWPTPEPGWMPHHLSHPSQTPRLLAGGWITPTATAALTQAPSCRACSVFNPNTIIRYPCFKYGKSRTTACKRFPYNYLPAAT